MKKLLGYDSFTGVTEIYHKHEPGKVVIEAIQDAEPVLKRNKIKSAEFNKKLNSWYVGTVPYSIVQKWSNECKHKPYTREWTDYARKQLNLPEYRAFNQNKIKL